MLAMTLCGAGFGLLMPNNSVWLAELAPEYARGRLLGGMTTCNFFGQFLSPLVFQPVIAFSGLYGILGVFGTAGNLTIALGLCFLIWSISITSKRG
jgi:MFS family permease